MAGPLLDTLYNSYDTTDLEIEGPFAHSEQVDVYFFEGYKQGYRGLTQCIYRASGPNRCDHWHSNLDLDEIAIYPNPLPQQVIKADECHEIGHSVGLTHPGDTGQGDSDPTFGCMDWKDPPLDDHLLAHNVSHINQYY